MTDMFILANFNILLLPSRISENEQVNNKKPYEMCGSYCSEYRRVPAHRCFRLVAGSRGFPF